MKMTDPRTWTTETEMAFCNLKQTLAGTSVLALPNYEKPFVRTADCKATIVTSVLLQKHGDKLRQVAYYSSKLDHVARAAPHGVKAVMAASIAVGASAEVALFHELKLLVPHAVSILILQTKMTFLSPARHPS